MKFNELYEINVNEKTEQKGGLTYLSWAWAWAEVKKRCPDASYKILRDENGLPYFKEQDVGYMCMTEVTIDGETLMMWLPVMDYKNRAMMNPTMFDINKTIMRCLTKNLGMFGLGLYIYAGEDLPEGEEEEKPKKKPKTTKETAEMYEGAEAKYVDMVKALEGLIHTLNVAGVEEDFWKEVKEKVKVKSLNEVDENNIVEVGRIARKRVMELE